MEFEYSAVLSVCMLVNVFQMQSLVPLLASCLICGFLSLSYVCIRVVFISHLSSSHHFFVSDAPNQQAERIAKKKKEEEEAAAAAAAAAAAGPAAAKPAEAKKAVEMTPALIRTKLKELLLQRGKRSTVCGR